MLQGHVLFGEIFQLINEIGITHFDINNDNDDVIIIESKSNVITSNKYRIAFVFWVIENRFSFFLFETEIIDEYLKTNYQAKQLLRELKTVLANKVSLIRYITSKQKINKEIIEYTFDIKGKEIVVAQTIKYRLIMPWITTKKIVDTYDGWLKEK